MNAQSVPNEGARKVVGWGLYLTGLAIGGLLFLVLFIIQPIGEGGGQAALAIAQSFLLAVPMMFVYGWVPWVADRYDPEPAWALAAVCAWGAFAATGFAGLANSVVGSVFTAALGAEVGGAATASLSAPLTEETMKGLAVFWMFYFQRRQFDGIVDGVVYGVFVALGFAAFENIIYYSRAGLETPEGGMSSTFVLRGLMTPWAHPIFTAMTGVGFGVARETTSRATRFFAPVLGLCGAMFLHFTWNLAASISGMVFLVMLPLWLVFVLGFAGLLLWLVARKGRIIRQHLEDEVMMGFMTPYELKLVGSPIAHLRATFKYGGALGRRFVDTAARLGLSKWHHGRAAMMQAGTMSTQYVLPLRQELQALRAQIGQKLGRVIPVPKPGQYVPPPGPQR